MTCLKCSVTGTVQGVFFRKYAKQEADRLGLTGWVKNESDGSVTIVIKGDDDDALTDYIGWLHQGSPNAMVLSVDVGPCPEGDWREFSIQQ